LLAATKGTHDEQKTTKKGRAGTVPGRRGESIQKKRGKGGQGSRLGIRFVDNSKNLREWVLAARRKAVKEKRKDIA